MITVRTTTIGKRLTCDTLALFFRKGESHSNRFVRDLPEAWRHLLKAPFDSGDFEAKPDQTCCVYTADARTSRLLLVGIAAEDTPKAWRQAAAVAAQRAGLLRTRHLGIALPNAGKAADRRSRAEAAAQGAILGAYRFDRFRTVRYTPSRLSRATLLGGTSSSARDHAEGAARGTIIAESQCLTRDLANLPSNEKPPIRLAEYARSAARKWGLRFRALAPAQMKKLGMGALLGVAQGSANPPRLIVLEHVPRRKRADTLALVGKGITFDSGGLSIKPADGMMTMKYDMSGGAAVIGALCACARLDVPVRVVGIIPAAENMPSGTAQRPGDIVRTMNGQTVEVLNTDAEGRLILCDALAYAATFQPAAIVDIATLTGACVVALGSENAALVGNNDRLIERLREASAGSGEPVWPMPLQEGYTALMNSPVADLKNIGGREAGVMTAAGFLSRFTEGRPWCHLDIAGVGWAGKETGLSREGPTGFGVRLFAQLAEDWRSLRSS